MTLNTVNPETLYLSYRKSRTASAESSDWFSQQKTSIDTQESPDFAERVYQSYQKNRSSEREASIDSIMSRIRLETGQTADHAATYIESLITLLKTLFNQPLVRIAVPAIAAGLLALAIVPTLLTDKNSTTTAVPPSLSAQAQAVSGYIDAGNATALGFSTGQAREKAAFNRGVLATNLIISAYSGEASSFHSVTQQVLTLASPDEQIAFNKLALSISGRLADSAVSSGTVPEVLRKELTGFRDLLYLNIDDNESRQWFEQGEVLQTVALAAQLKLATGQSDPLQDSLATLAESVTPQSTVPAQSLLEQLKALASEDEPDTRETRIIIKIGRDIKLLMQ